MRPLFVDSDDIKHASVTAGGDMLIVNEKAIGAVSLASNGKKRKADEGTSANAKRIKYVASGDDKFKMAVEGPDGVYVGTNGDVHVTSDGMVRTLDLPVFSLLYGGYYIKFLPNGNLGISVAHMAGLTIYEREGENLVAEMNFPLVDNRERCLYVYKSMVVVVDHRQTKVFAVEGEYTDVGAVMGRLPCRERITSATVLEGDVYCVVDASTSDAQWLYKNGRCFRTLPAPVRQIVSHPSHGLLAVKGKSLVPLDTRWSKELYPSLVEELKRTVYAVLLLAKRTGCPLQRLPGDMIHEILARVVD